MIVVFKIDGTTLVYPPRSVRVIAPQMVAYETGTGKLVTQPSTPGQIELQWGGDAAKIGVVAELKARRSTAIAHTLNWTTEVGGATYTQTVAIPPITYGQQAPATTVEPFTLKLEIL
jgi:hypothetical protein